MTWLSASQLDHRRDGGQPIGCPLSRAWLLAVVLVAAISATIGVPVGVARAGSIGPWGVAPATTETNQKARPFFDYRQPAGGVIRDAISIANLGDYPLTFDLYSADGYNLANGAFALRGKAERKTGVGAWISLAVTAVTAPPHEQAIVPFTLSVPTDATPGDYAGGIVALARPVATPAPGSQIVTRQGVGARIYLRVPGPLHPSLAVTDLTVDAHTGPFGGGHARIHAVLVNTGNARLNAIARIRITGPFGATAQTIPSLRLDSFLPGSRIDLTRAWPSLPFAGPYRASISVRAPSASATGTKSLWIIPWAVLVIVALVIAALTVSWRRRRRPSGTSPGPSTRAPVDHERAAAGAG